VGAKAGSQRLAKRQKRKKGLRGLKKPNMITILVEKIIY